jgi:acyl-CoA reductase-like NAD-dependent aldehyde dehydrogenase
MSTSNGNAQPEANGDTNGHANGAAVHDGEANGTIKSGQGDSQPQAPTVELKYTPIDDIPKIRQELQAGFDTGRTRSIKYRKEQILGLAYMMKDNAQRFVRALKHDLGRPALETHLTEIGKIIQDCAEAHKKIGKWSKTESAPFNHNFFLMGPKIRKEPKGVVLIIAPFNFPLLLLLGPLVGAIAAGNAAVIKPSELVPATSTLLAELVPRYLDQQLYRLVNGAIPETTKVDLLFTGQ